MYCKYCGQAIDEDSVYCHTCGKYILHEDEASKEVVVEVESEQVIAEEMPIEAEDATYKTAEDVIDWRATFEPSVETLRAEKVTSGEIKIKPPEQPMGKLLMLVIWGMFALGIISGVLNFANHTSTANLAETVGMCASFIIVFLAGIAKSAYFRTLAICQALFRVTTSIFIIILLYIISANYPGLDFSYLLENQMIVLGIGVFLLIYFITSKKVKGYSCISNGATKQYSWNILLAISMIIAITGSMYVLSQDMTWLW